MTTQGCPARAGSARDLHLGSGSKRILLTFGEFLEGHSWTRSMNSELEHRVRELVAQVMEPSSSSLLAVRLMGCKPPEAAARSQDGPVPLTGGSGFRSLSSYRFASMTPWT